MVDSEVRGQIGCRPRSDSVRRRWGWLSHRRDGENRRKDSWLRNTPNSVYSVPQRWILVS